MHFVDVATIIELINAWITNDIKVKRNCCRKIPRSTASPRQRWGRALKDRGRQIK